MKNGKCKFNYPRKLIDETRTNSKRYPLYRRSTTNGGFKTNIKMKIILGKYKTVEIDNRWIVPYCPFILKLLKEHINTEICM